MKLNGKTLARLAVVQLLYQYQFNDRDQTLPLLVENIQNFGSRILTFNHLTIYLTKFFIALKTVQKFQ